MKSALARRGENGNTKLATKCYTTQVGWLNKQQRKRDYQLPMPTNIKVIRSKVPGRGKFRQLLPEQIQRDVFTKATISFRARAGNNSNHTHMINLACGCSLTLYRLAWETLDYVVRNCHFAVFAFTCDTASYRFLYAGHKGSKATETHLLGLHGRLLWGNEALETQEDEVIAKPAALDANSAACQWSGFEATLPPALFNVLTGDVPKGCRAFACHMGCDEHSVNKMIEAHLQEMAAKHDRLFIVPAGWCKQHGTGNILQPVINMLGIFPPSYCCAKRMRQDTFYKSFLEAVKAELDKCMVWIRKSDRPEWRSAENHTRYATAIMELRSSRPEAPRIQSGR